MLLDQQHRIQFTNSITVHVGLELENTNSVYFWAALSCMSQDSRTPRSLIGLGCLQLTLMKLL